MSAFRSFLDNVLSRWPAWALFSCALMLGIAHAFETFGKLPPCAMCLTQREFYWLAGGVAFILLLAPRLKGAGLVRPGLWLLALLFAIELGVAVFHAGLEWKWWEMASCSSQGFIADLLGLPPPRMKADDLMAMLKGGPARAIQCDDALWRFPASWGLSMAGWNAIIALKLTVFSVLAAAKRKAA